MNLSVVVIAKNEEVNIRRCIAALIWCDDVLVVDDYSNDRTREIAESLGARVLQNHFRSFASQRNWALEFGELRHDWVLMLDADEIVTEPLRIELESRLPDAFDGTVGFLMCRKTMFMDRWLRFSDGFPVWIMRLVRRGKCCFADAGHGEEPVPAVDGALSRIQEPFLHYPFSKGLADWVTRHNRYSTLESHLEVNGDSPIRVQSLFSTDRAARRKTLRQISRRLPFRPFGRFCFHLFLKGGIFDGRAGLTYAYLMSVYEALIVLKARELRRQRHGSNSTPLPFTSSTDTSGTIATHDTSTDGAGCLR